MDVNTKIDIGQNIVSLLERLAQQIGTTADKVFPWYVQQAQVEGWTALAGFAAYWFFVAVLLLSTVWKADFHKGNKWAFACGVALVLAIVGTLPTAIEVPEAARKVINPNYYAMTMMTRDIGRLTARR